MRYKIAHIAKPIAGVGVYVQLIINNINEELFENVLVCNLDDSIIDIKDRAGRDIQKYHANIIREINPLKDIKALFSTINHLKKIKPDIIHCHSAKAGIIGRIAGLVLGIKTIYTPHAFSYLSSNKKIVRFIYKFIEKSLITKSTKILAVSESEKNRALNELNIAESKVLQWNNSIPDIKITSKPSLLNIPKDYICAIGRPSYQKNIEFLLTVLAETKKSKKDIHLVLLGIGHYSPEIQNVERIIEANNLNENMTIVPWLERADTLSILKDSGVYVSTARYEGLPYSLIEALCLAKPCVATNVDGNKDLIKNGVNGYLVKEGDVSGMSERILKILSDNKKYESFALNSRAIWEANYNIENTIARIENIYLTEIKQD